MPPRCEKRFDSSDPHLPRVSKIMEIKNISRPKFKENAAGPARPAFRPAPLFEFTQNLDPAFWKALKVPGALLQTFLINFLGEQ